MDSRVREHAALLVDHCTGVEAGDDVLVWAPASAEELVVAVFEACGERGANPTVLWDCPRAERAYMRAVAPEAVGMGEHLLAQMEATDVSITIGAGVNAFETSDVDPAVRSARSRVRRPHMEAYLSTRWVGTHHPSPGDAQRAGMSTAGYAEFLYDAMLRDWGEQRAFQERVAEVLESASEVRVVSGGGTDVRMSVAGNHAEIDDGRKNMPGGEVFTVPIPETVEGTVVFDVPSVWRGREIRDARLVFEGGEVVEYDAAANEDALGALLETDEGARRVGEIGFGTNRDITEATGNVAFDEKIGETVHLALGRTIEEAVGAGNPTNESTVHVDLVCDLREEGFVEVDGEIVQRNGRFAFEDE